MSDATLPAQGDHPEHILIYDMTRRGKSYRARATYTPDVGYSVELRKWDTHDERWRLSSSADLATAMLTTLTALLPTGALDPLIEKSLSEGVNADPDSDEGLPDSAEDPE